MIMNNFYKEFISAIIFSICASATSLAQQLDAASRLDAYYQENIPLKIYLFHNQPAYAPGDTIFFRGYLLTVDGLKPIQGRQIVHVELIDASGNIVKGINILARDGIFYNQLKIPEDLPDGNYLIASFNNWMRNTAAEFYFRKEITISGASKIQPLRDYTDWSIHPEGGKAIIGFNNKIVVKGKPDTQVVVRSSTDKIVSSFLTDPLGFGSFYINPVAGEQYYLYPQGVEEGIHISNITDDGLSIQLLQSNDKIDIIFQIPDRSVLKQTELNYVLHHHAELLVAGDISFHRQNSGIIRIPRKDLPDGVLRISVLNRQNEQISERLFFNVSAKKSTAEVSLSKEYFSHRERVDAHVKIMNEEGEQVEGNFAITVYRTDLFQGHNAPSNILQKLLLTSDVPDDSFSRLMNSEFKELSSLQIDNYLISRRWNRFNWGDLANTTQSNTFLFQSHLEISAQINSLSGIRSIPDSLIVSCYLQKSQDIYETYSDKNGKFGMALLFDVWDDDEVLIFAKSKGRLFSSLTLEFTKPQAHNLKASPFNIRDELSAYSTYANVRKRVADSYYNSYNSKIAVQSKPDIQPHSKIEREIRGVDLSVNFADYYIFPTMEETIREIIPWLQHRKTNQGNVVRLYLTGIERTGQDAPLFIIDGVMTNQTDYFLALKPSEVISVKIVNSPKKLEYFGALGTNGIVLVETKIPGNNAQVPRGSSTIKISGLSNPIEFSSVVNNNYGNQRIPDVRPVLLWKPFLKTNNEGEFGLSFFTSDDTGKYRIVVEGFTSEGQPFSAFKDFQVRGNYD